MVIAFEELHDLHEIVERGPDWNEIERIVVTLNRRSPLERPERAVEIDRPPNGGRHEGTGFVRRASRIARAARPPVPRRLDARNAAGPTLRTGPPFAAMGETPIYNIEEVRRWLTAGGTRGAAKARRRARS